MHSRATAFRDGGGLLVLLTSLKHSLHKPRGRE